MTIQVRTDRNSLVIGQTRSGKTTLQMWLAEQAAATLPADRIRLINPRREGAVHAYAERHGIEELVPPLTGRGNVPPELADPLRRWFGRGNVLLVVDELQMVSRAGDPDPAWRYWYTAGNGRGCAVWACCTRVAFVPMEAITEAAHVWCFRMTDPASQQKLAARSRELADLVAGLGEYQWAHHELGSAPTIGRLEEKKGAISGGKRTKNSTADRDDPRH